MVKLAFLDTSLREKYRLSSANSINIARLIPQSFYYFDAFRQLKDKSAPVYFSVPSGNFGNLTAGLLAKRMGLPIAAFIASTNENNSVPRYLNSGEYEPTHTIATISNAMDVGAPSNFARMNHLYHESVDEMRSDITGYYFSDTDTRSEMINTYSRYRYMLDPHAAVGLLGWKEFKKSAPDHAQGIVLETAHPTKFIDVVKETLNIEPEIPKALADLITLEKKSVLMGPEYEGLKSFLMSR